MATIGTPVVIDLGDCNDCCDSGACLICGLADQLTSRDIYATVTAATGLMATTWFGPTGYVPLPHSFLLDAPIADGAAFTDPSVEVCGGLVTTMSLTAACAGNAVRMAASFGLSRDSTCDAGTEIPAIDGSSDDPDEITITLGEVVCDEEGFVSVDFVADCGAYGTFSGSIHR